jgi:hypothetical protein
MASITLSGILLDPNSDFAVGDEIRFTHASTTGQTVKGAVSVVTIAPGGTYSLALQYGLVLVEYKDIRSTQFKNLGIATVNGSNPATTIPELLNALVPVSSAELIEFQAILADCVTAKNAAELAAANLIATQITTTELIASSSTYAADAIITTQGFSVAGVGSGPWVQTGVTGLTASQSPSQLVGSLCTDGNGNQWRLMNDGQISISQLGGLVGSNNGAVVFAFNASSATTLDLEGLTWPARDIDCDNATDKGKLQKSFINGTLIVVNSFVNDVDLQTIQPFAQDEIAVSGKKSQVLTWKDKRVLWLGTSIPHQGVGSDGYPELLSSTLDFTVSNWSWSGSHAFYNIAGDAFDSGTVRALSMTEADRLAGLALYGSTSAYDDSFNNVTIASQMTAEYRIKNQFIANSYDVVVLDHNHNDRKSVQTYTVNDKTLTAITKGTTTVVAVNNTTGLTVGDGAYLQVTGIANLQYAAARITAISSLDVTLAIDSSGYAGTFTAGTLHWVDRNTLEGSFDFLIAYTKNMGIIYGNSAVDIVLCNAPSYFTNNTNRDFSIWNSGKTIKSVADKWSLGYFDVAATLDLIYSQHLIYFPDAVHPSTLETRKALASYWASWMSGGAQTVTNAADSLAKNKLVLDAHQELALFSKYDDAYAYRANLFSDDTPIISEDFSGGIGTWTVTSTPPVIEAAPWGAGVAAKFAVTAGTPQPYITKTSALGFDPVLEFDLYFPTISLATGVSNQITVFTLLTADATTYSVSVIQSVGGDARLSVSRSDGVVLPVNIATYLIGAATKYTIKADIIKGDTTSSDGYILLTVNGVKLYADTFANGGVSTIASTRLGAVFNNMGSSFNFFISNIVTGGKTRSPAINWSEIQKPLTTLGLIASTAAFSSSTVINTTCYSNIFDRGPGAWAQNGVTGQAVSQSPVQLNDAGLLNDGNGNQWALITSGGGLLPESIGAVTSQSLAGADSIADSYSIFTAILSWAARTNYLGRTELGTGYYRLSQTLYVNQQLVFNGKGKNESYFHATHTSGPAVRFGQGNSGITNAGVTGSVARRTAAYSPLNIGVLFEGDDVPENQSGAPRLTHCILENYYVFGHGSSGVHVVGPAFTGSLNHPDVNTMKGHGISFDRGELTSRVNLITAVIGGLCNITDGRINNCGGHAIAAGSPTSAFSTPALRVVINNIEGEENGTDPAVRFYNTPVWLRGSNHVFENSGLGVAQAGGASAWVAGRNIHLTNNRSLVNYTNTYVIGSFDELPTDGIYINGFSVINPTAPLNPAVLVQLPAGETIEPRNIFIQQGEDLNITKLVGTDATMSSSDYRRVPRLFINGARPPVYKTENQVVNNSISVVDDTSLKVWLAPNEKVIFELSMEYDGGAGTDLRVSIGAPGGSSLSYGPSSNSLKVGDGDVAAIQGNTSGTLIFGASPTSHRLLCIKGTCTNGATGGYINTRWAQSVAGASDTTVYSGLSYIQLTNVYS